MATAQPQKKQAYTFVTHKVYGAIFKGNLKEAQECASVSAPFEQDLVVEAVLESKKSRMKENDILFHLRKIVKEVRGVVIR